jgi:hypothetical protein
MLRPDLAQLGLQAVDLLREAGLNTHFEGVHFLLKPV